MASNKTDTGIFQKIFTTVLSIIITIAMSISSYALVTLINIDKRVSVIESNKFTATDSMELKEMINSLKSEISNLPYKYPIESINKKIDDNCNIFTVKVESLAERVNNIEKKLIQINPELYKIE